MYLVARSLLLHPCRDRLSVRHDTHPTLETAALAQARTNTATPVLTLEACLIGAWECRLLLREAGSSNPGALLGRGARSLLHTGALRFTVSFAFVLHGGHVEVDERPVSWT